MTRQTWHGSITCPQCESGSRIRESWMGGKYLVFSCGHVVTPVVNDGK